MTDLPEVFRESIVFLEVEQTVRILTVGFWLQVLWRQLASFTGTLELIDLKFFF
jgi:hypothetical protein